MMKPRKEGVSQLADGLLGSSLYSSGPRNAGIPYSSSSSTLPRQSLVGDPAKSGKGESLAYLSQ